MDPVVLEILSWLQTIFSALLGVVIGILTARLNKNKTEAQKIEDRQKAGNSALRCLVRKAIIDFYDLYVAQKVPFTIERTHELTELYKAYKALDGDGVVDKMYEELMALPTTVIGKDDIDE